MQNDRPIGVIGAMQVEIEALLAAGELLEVKEHAGVRYHTLRLSGVRCVAAQCGVGKVNAALCAQGMADLFHPRLLINIGVAGGTGPQVRIGDLVIGSHCVQYDYDTTPIGEPMATLTLPGRGLLRELPCDAEALKTLRAAAQGLYGAAHVGPIATGDRFVADRALGRRLYETYGALACEMEGGAIAQAALLNGIPCAVLRAISDGANDGSPVDFPTFAAESAEKAQKLLSGAIGAL